MAKRTAEAERIKTPAILQYEDAATTTNDRLYLWREEHRNCAAFLHGVVLHYGSRPLQSGDFQP